MSNKGQSVVTGNLPVNAASEAPTSRYFNNYFNAPYTTTPNINDATIGYFESITGSKETAQTLAAAVLYTALSQDLNPMEIVDQFRELGPAELDSYLCMFLNLNRVNTSLLGITNVRQTNKYIQRAILP